MIPKKNLSLTDFLKVYTNSVFNQVILDIANQVKIC